MIIFTLVVLIAIFLYFWNIRTFLPFIKAKEFNIILVVISIFILSYIFDLISFSHKEEKSLNTNELLLIVGKVFIMLVITSFLEFAFFFSSRIGRIAYFNIFWLLSAIFLLERKLKLSEKIKGKPLTIGWFSAVSPAEVGTNYSLKPIMGEILTDEGDLENPDLIIYDASLKNRKDMPYIIQKIIEGTEAIDLISFIEKKTDRIPLKYVDEVWLLHHLKAKKIFYLKVKSFLDFLVALLLLILLFPIGFAFALIHCLESKGPILYKQKRMGYRGREFNLIKFRTMIPNAEEEGPRFAIGNDPRITRIGRIMRKFRMDEIPQLINVLRGEMSLIGPRPERKVFIEKLEKEIPFYRLRLEVKPGITGWAQVNHKYAGESIEDHKKKLEYDLFYIKNRDLILDMVTILKTAKTMLKLSGT